MVARSSLGRAACFLQRATIQRLEEERTALRRDGRKESAPSGAALKGTPLYQGLHPKCANPACPTAFQWLAGGKFFRFRSEEVSPNPSDPASSSPIGVHGVKHYWLCERCCHVFSLVYEDQYGVLLKLLWTQLPVAEVHKELSAA